jgi:DsbC/DsbD-like thiol-disulfide interchange protein
MRGRWAHSTFQFYAAGCLCMFVASSEYAQSFSQWDADTRSAVRLLEARSRIELGVTIRRAGIEIKLHPGWKTYGRDPGDSGVPPVFDFSGSENIKSVTVRWPAPERISEGAGYYFLGYKDGVVFPLHVVPKDEKKPVMLRLKLDYAVCESLCVPAKAKVELVLTGKGDEVSEALLSAAEARVP